VSLVNIFFIKSELIVTLIAIVLGAVYSIYLLIDTQLIMGGRNKSLTLDNYVLGSVILYIDIVQLFLQILKILGDKKKRD
jgi:FtsH-binding integral membrane protein